MSLTEKDRKFNTFEACLRLTILNELEAIAKASKHLTPETLLSVIEIRRMEIAKNTGDK
jgi:hypothetical protein